MCCSNNPCSACWLEQHSHLTGTYSRQQWQQHRKDYETDTGKGRERVAEPTKPHSFFPGTTTISPTRICLNQALSHQLSFRTCSCYYHNSISQFYFILNMVVLNQIKILMALAQTIKANHLGKMGVHKLHPSPKEGVEGVRQKEKKLAQSNSKRRALALGCGHSYSPHLHSHFLAICCYVYCWRA